MWNPKYDGNSERARRGHQAEKELMRLLRQHDLNVKDTWAILAEKGLTENASSQATKYWGDVRIRLTDDDYVFVELKTTRTASPCFKICESSLKRFFGGDRIYCLALTEDDGAFSDCCFIKSATLSRYMRYKELETRESDGWQYRRLSTDAIKKKKFNQAISWNVEGFSRYLLNRKVNR